jgi:hypothetical protein
MVSKHTATVEGKHAQTIPSTLEVLEYPNTLKNCPTVENRDLVWTWPVMVAPHEFVGAIVACGGSMSPIYVTLRSGTAANIA